jgi:hypothetical protein
MSAPTKSAFLAAYEKEVRAAHMYSDSKFSKNIKEAAKFISEKDVCYLCALNAWEAIGMTGEPTLAKLRRLKP